MERAIKDGIVSLGKQKFHYENCKIPFGDRPGMLGTVMLSELDDKGNKNGSFVRIHYNGSKESYDETDPVLIGTQKDGRFSGARYLFQDGKLVKIKTADGAIITQQNLAFKAYEKMAPDVSDCLKLLKNVESYIENKSDTQSYADTSLKPNGYDDR